MSQSHAANFQRKGQSAASRVESQGSAPLWLTGLAKAGYAARGVIYVIIGALALLQAVGRGGGSTDTKGAVSSVLQAPGGVFLLWAIVVGLVGYAAWRLCQGLLDADNHGTDAKGLAIRGGLVTSAIMHTLLAVYAGKLALSVSGASGGGQSGGGSSESWVAKMLGWPGGQWIVGLVGACIIGAGVAHAVKARRAKYKKHFDLDPEAMSRFDPVCKIGLYARGVAFAIIGGMFIWAAVTQQPENAGGLGEVLNEAAQGAFGSIALGSMALGLLAFGLYSVLEAMFRRIDKPAAL